MTEFGKKRENAKSDKTNIHSGKQGHKNPRPTVKPVSLGFLRGVVRFKCYATLQINSSLPVDL